MMTHRALGFSYIELIVTLAIVAILASVTMPLVSVTVQRSKESELRHHLRSMREAIDAYKLEYRRRYITTDEMLSVLTDLGYRRD